MNRGTRATAITIAIGAILAATVFVGFGLWFAPGWANGWPLGLPRTLVWSAGLASVAFVAILTFTAGVGAVVCEAVRGEAQAWPPAGWYRAWVLASFWLSFLAALTVYGILRVQAAALWP